MTYRKPTLENYKVAISHSDNRMEDQNGCEVLETTIHDLPIELLLYIFRFLDWRERIDIMCVCKRWSNVINGNIRNLFPFLDTVLVTDESVRFLNRCMPLQLYSLRICNRDQRLLGDLGRALARATQLTMTCEEPLTGDLMFSGLTNVVSLNMVWRYFLPDGVFENLQLLPQLERLSVGGILSSRWHPGRPLPSAVLSLTHLVSLHARNCAITSIPDFISQLCCLQELDLRSNRISTLTSGLEQLTMLQTIDLGYNHLERFSLSLRFLPNLVSLNLESNYPLSCIDDSVFAVGLDGRHHALESLRLTYCRQLLELPASIRYLTRLKCIDLQHTRTRLPSSFSSLSSLTILHAHGATWQTPLPEDMFASRSPLQELDMSSNSLTELPPSCAHLAELTSLNISDNLFYGVPHAIEQMKNLRSLNLAYTLTPSLPEFLGKLRYLSELSVFGNPLNTYPPVLRNMTQLTTLNLAKIGLRELPSTIGELVQLDTLHLCYNNIQTLPESMACLVNLRILRLGMNDLHGPLPEWFSLLKCLEILDLSNNHIESVRSLYDSTRLFHLDLAYNMLRSVPDRKRLPSLTQLFIQGNPAIQQMPMAPAG